MKLDRLLAITMTLLNQPRISAVELAKRFEVSLRTIYRDMEAINLAGIPIVSYAGSDGGYEIMSGYRLDKQVLSIEEFTAIYTALRGVRTATDQADIDGIMERIGALMPAHSKAEGLQHLDLDFQPSPNDKLLISPLHRAIKKQKVVRFAYLDGNGTETERLTEPMGIFLKGFVWYMYAYCLKRKDLRVFRLSRMSDLEERPESFTRRDYTLQDVEQQFMEKADFERIKAVLQFQSHMITRVRDEFGYDQVERQADGTLVLKTSFSAMDRAVKKVLSYGSHVKVLEPDDLIQELKLHIHKLSNMYTP